MVDLGQLSQSNSYAQISGPGFGTRMLCRPLTEHKAAPVDASMWLTGLRRANALSMNTNDIPNAHMRSPGRFLEFFQGLTDPGDIQFEACWKNDLPKGASVGPSDFQRWQAPLESDVGDASVPAGQNKEGFFHSMFYDSLPFEAWVIPPQWTRGLIIVRGYAKMVGPFPHEMEGVINFQGAFKASGKPMLLRGERQGTGPLTVGSDIAAAAAVADIDSQTITRAANVRWRAVASNLLTEVWSSVGDMAAWAEPIAAGEWNVYKYTEDEGFGEAF